MKPFIISHLVYIFLLIIGCGSQKQITPTANKDELNAFTAYYLHVSESTYEEVKIEKGKLYFTFHKDIKPADIKWENGNPLIDKTKINTKESLFLKQDMDSLLNKINEYKFWGLADVIGNPNKGESYTIFKLSFKTISQSKTVIFNSIPGGITMPVAFKKSRDELMKLARQKTT